MNIRHTQRGFEVLEITGNRLGVRLEVQQSSAIKQLEDKPGASYLWIGAKDESDDADVCHLDRDQVFGLARSLLSWWAQGTLQADRLALDIELKIKT
jgi:hypothetical protein